MKAEMIDVPWWNGYQTWMITDTPDRPTSEQVSELISWKEQNVRDMFLPAPFEELMSCHPWRHLAHERWDRCIGSIHGITNKSFVDIGGNTGYYAFLAKAFGANRAVLVDESETSIVFASRLEELYQVGIEAYCQKMEERDWENFDVGFSFSALPYLGQKNFPLMKSVLEQWSRKFGVLFLEMGDGGSFLKEVETLEQQKTLFIETGWLVEYLGTTWASHSGTDRPLWKLIGQV